MKKEVLIKSIAALLFYFLWIFLFSKAIMFLFTQTEVSFSIGLFIQKYLEPAMSVKIIAFLIDFSLIYTALHFLFYLPDKRKPSSPLDYFTLRRFTLQDLHNSLHEKIIIVFIILSIFLIFANLIQIYLFDFLNKKLFTFSILVLCFYIIVFGVFSTIYYNEHHH